MAYTGWNRFRSCKYWPDGSGWTLMDAVGKVLNRLKLMNKV
jgi:hypothetical protein